MQAQHATFKIGKNKYKLTTWNLKGEHPAEAKLKECFSSDIIFLQGGLKRSIQYFEKKYHLYFGHEPDKSGYTAVLVKKTEFEQGEQLPVISFSDIADGRHCTVKLNGMVGIAWDGPLKVPEENGRETTAERYKIKYFQGLQKYIFDQVEKYNMPVIIGGDFKLTSSLADGNKEEPENCNHKLQKSEDDSQYFYVVFPIFEMQNVMTGDKNKSATKKSQKSK